MQRYGQLLITLILAMFIIGCTTKNVTEVNNPVYNTTVQPATVYAVGSKYFCSFCNVYHSYKLAEYVDVGGITTIPIITIGGDTLPIYDWYATDIMFLNEYAEMPFGTVCPLNVVSDHGTTNVNATCPDSFNIISPLNNSTISISPGSDTLISVVWQNSNGSEWYYFATTISISYIDTLGQYKYAYYSYDNPVEDTSFALNLKEVFSGHYDEIDSITYGYGYVDVMASSGPMLKPGSIGNINGADKGFYWLRYQPLGIDFMINNTPKSVKFDKIPPHANCDSLWWAKAKELGYVQGEYRSFSYSCNKIKK